MPGSGSGVEIARPVGVFSPGPRPSPWGAYVSSSTFATNFSMPAAASEMVFAHM